MGILGVIFFIFIIFLAVRHVHRMKYLARSEYRTAKGELKEINEEEGEEKREKSLRKKN